MNFFFFFFRGEGGGGGGGGAPPLATQGYTCWCTGWICITEL
jgi:hypothetical protein